MSDNINLNYGAGGDTLAADDFNGVKHQRVRSNNVNVVLSDDFDTLDNTKWNTVSTGSGDIIRVEGNSFGLTWLTISKDPLTVNTVSAIESIKTFNAPIEVSVGAHISQRTVGQEMAIDIVDTSTPLTSVSDIAISSISQTTTTLTVNTATPHGLLVGSRICIYGCNYSPFNYSGAVVAGILSTTSFTVTVSNGSALPSVTSGPYTTGYVAYRPALNYAVNGISQIFEVSSATTSNFYVRSGIGEVYPSGTAGGNHGITCGSTNSVQPNAANLGVYGLLPTTEYKYALHDEKVYFSDVAVDTTTAAASARLIRNAVIPDTSKSYKLRFRATNTRSITVPVAKILTAVKTGTTTATITTDVAHGLTTTDSIAIYGNRDSTNFANTTSLTVASVINSTQFTVVYGTAVTATTYGGTVYKQQGAITPGNLGAIANNIQSASRTNNVVTIVGAVTFASLFLVGDFINLHGVVNTSGVSLGIDGAYRVNNISTTSVTLEPLTAPTGADITSTNCGGTVIKRTDFRISYTRVLNVLRNRLDISSKLDNASSLGVIVNSTAASTNAIGDVGVQYRTSTTGAATPISAMSPATPAVGTIKSTSGRLLGFNLNNSSSGIRSVKFFNATAPTLGTTTALFEVDIPAGASVSYNMEGGIAFGTAITWSCTSAKGLTDNTSTGLALGDVSGFFVYA